MTEATDDPDPEKLKAAMAVLASVGIRMAVSACSCCESPSVRLEFKGEEVIHSYLCNFDMFAE